MKKTLYLHADDYGMGLGSSRRIIKCFTDGNLDCVSIMANGCYEEALGLLEKYPVHIRVHLNLVEGRPVSRAEEIPLLVDEQGYFKYSFFGLFLLLLTSKRKELQRQIKIEIKAQIQMVAQSLGTTCIGIDSHQHVHMIPGVFHVLCEALQEVDIQVEEMRIPAEPITPFLKHPSLYRTYHLVNIIKNLVLNVCYLYIRPTIRRLGIHRCLFMGIWFSGHMDAQRVLKVFPDFVKIAKKRGLFLELLFHPGDILPGEEPLDKRKPLFTKFYYDEGRKIEASALMSGDFYKQLAAMNELEDTTAVPRQYAS